MRVTALLTAFGTVALAGWAQQPPPGAQGPRAESRKLAQEWREKMGHGAGKLQPGDPAPDFNLKRLRESVRLSSFAAASLASIPLSSRASSSPAPTATSTVH